MNLVLRPTIQVIEFSMRYVGNKVYHFTLFQKFSKYAEGSTSDDFRYYTDQIFILIIVTENVYYTISTSNPWFEGYVKKWVHLKEAKEKF